MTIPSAAEHTAGQLPKQTPRAIAIDLRLSGMACNCDLDNWQPEQSTGHSWVCRIHKAAIAKATGAKP